MGLQFSDLMDNINQSNILKVRSKYMILHTNVGFSLKESPKSLKLSDEANLTCHLLQYFTVMWPVISECFAFVCLYPPRDLILASNY